MNDSFYHYLASYLRRRTMASKIGRETFINLGSRGNNKNKCSKAILMEEYGKGIKILKKYQLR